MARPLNPNERHASYAWLKIPLSKDLLDGTQKDTGIGLPLNSIILGAFVNVRTPEATGATKTIKVGFVGADEAGLINGLDVGPGQDGWQQVSPADGTTGVYMTESQGEVNLPIPNVDDATPFNASVTSASAFSDLDADVWLLFVRLPDGALPAAG